MRSVLAISALPIHGKPLPAQYVIEADQGLDLAYRALDALDMPEHRKHLSQTQINTLRNMLTTVANLRQILDQSIAETFITQEDR